MEDIEKSLFKKGYHIVKKDFFSARDLRGHKKNYILYQDKYWEICEYDADNHQLVNDNVTQEIPTKELIGSKIIGCCEPQKQDVMKSSLAYLKRWIFNNQSTCITLLLLCLFCEFMALLEPILLNVSLGHLEMFTNQKEWLVPFLFGSLIILFGMSILYLKQKYSVLYTGNVALQIARDLWHKFLVQDLQTIAAHSPNDMYTRMYAMEQVFYRLIQQLVAIVQDSLFFFLNVMLLFIFSWPLACLELLFMLIIASTHYFCLNKYFNQSKVVSDKQQNHVVFFLEIFQNLATIKIFKQEWAFWQLWQSRVIPYWRGFLENDFFQDKVSISIELLRKVNGLFILIIGLYLIYLQQMKLGTFVAFLALKSQVSARFEGVFKRFMQWQYLKTPIIRIQEVMSKLVVHSEHKHSLDINLESLEYVRHKIISKNFICGKKYLIRGVSGCGKTSLLKCILGLISPISGTVISSNNVAAVLQSDSVFSGTIQENISFFASEIDAHKLSRVKKLVGITLDSSASVAGLSQGEKQRVLIARALYAESDWLILDEATCHLDTRAENELLTTLLEQPFGLIMVSHGQNICHFFDESVELD